MGGMLFYSLFKADTIFLYTGQSSDLLVMNQVMLGYEFSSVFVFIISCVYLSSLKQHCAYFL